MAEYKIVDAEKLDADLTEIADEVRTLIDTSDKMTIDEITSNVAQANADVDSQTDLIAQIKTALNGKAGSSATELGALIDQSGVLESTDGTATEKVEQLIDKAEDENLWYEASKNASFGVGTFMDYTGARLPKLDLSNATNIGNLVRGSKKLERIDDYLNTQNCTQFYSTFANTSALKYIKGINTAKGTNFNSMFNGSAIETIEEPLDVSSATSLNSSFSCSNLKDISFVAETIKVSIAIPSPVLTPESIQSIIDGLATVETAQTLTLNATVKAKLTEKQIATITDKNWNLA